MEEYEYDPEEIQAIELQDLELSRTVFQRIGRLVLSTVAVVDTGAAAYGIMTRDYGMAIMGGIGAAISAGGAVHFPESPRQIMEYLGLQEPAEVEE